MPNIYFIIFELCIYIQLAICLTHAWKHGTTHVLRLLAGTLFGLSLELATIRQIHAYQYRQFLIMILDVPLCIGVAWSCILYSVMEFSDASNLPYFARPLLDAFLALNIDLSLDGVAIRFGFWDWGMGLQAQYFGVPWANFWAWFWVIFFFSLGYRLLAHRPDWIGIWVAPLLAYLIGLAGVLGTNALIVFGVAQSIRTQFIFTIIMIAFLLMLLLRPKLHLTSVPALTFWIPFITHAYILVAGFIAGILLALPFLLLMGVLMTCIACALHYPTIQKFSLFAKREIL